MTKGPELTHLLLAICGALILVIGAEWAYLNYGIRQSSKILEQPVDSDVAFDQVASHDFVLAPKESFSEIVERPLMIQGRRPVSEEAEAALIESPANRGNIQLKLMGVVMSPQGMTALLQNGKGAYQRLQVDGLIDGWEVAEIHADRVILEQGASTEEIKLRKPKPKDPLPELVKKPKSKSAASRTKAKQPQKSGTSKQSASK